jgi:hypothetical protein
MSELAFDEDGQRFQVPATVTRWRVRRFNNPGRPGGAQVVYGDDGLPLFLDVDATAEEFREAVGSRPGRYRLDGLNAQSRVEDGVPPAYLMINAGAPSAESNGGGSVGGGERAYNAPPPTTSSLEYAVVELARANRDALTTMTDRFSSVCDAMATVVRAVDGAGLPRRAPLGPLLVDQIDDEDDDDGDDDDGERNAAPPAPPATFATLLGQVVQMVQAFAMMNGKGPAQLEAAVGQVVETARVVESVAMANGSAPDEAANAFTEAVNENSDANAPAPIARGTQAVTETHAVHVPRPAARPAGGRPAAVVSAAAAASPAASSLTNGDPAVQFQQIMATLTPEEQAQVQMVITRLSMGDLMQWYEQLARMTVAEGVARIRAELARLPVERAA